MKTVTFSLFGIVREKVGQSEVTIQTAAETVGLALEDLWQQQDLDPILPKRETWLRVARGNEYLGWDERLHGTDQLALIPPVSGG